MESVQMNARLMDGGGYRYFLIPAGMLNADRDVRVQVHFNNQVFTTDARFLQDGSHMVILNRETEFNYDLEGIKNVDVSIQRIDAPPQLMDFSADVLTALARFGIEENFKRLPPATQHEIQRRIETAPDPDSRARRIRETVEFLLNQDANLPRGDSL